MKPKHILLGMLALLVASCTNDEMNEVAALKQDGIQVTAGLDANTRVGFEQDGNVTHAFWEEGDQITLYTPSQGALQYQVTTLGEGGYSATFSAIGDVLKNTDETIYAAYPETDITDGIATLPFTDTWTDEHPMPFGYAVSKVTNGKVPLSFNHLYAYLKLTLNAETVAGSDVKEITDIYITNPSGTPVALAAGRFDFDSQSIIEDKGVNYMYYTLQEPFTATGDAEKSIYIPILPQSAGENLTLSVLHQQGNACDTLFSVSKEIPRNGFIAGHAYTYSPKASFIREGNTITLTEAGTLSQAIPVEAKDTITTLKIVGPLNGDDIRFIREMAGCDVYGDKTEGKLTNLDISECTIVEGGDYYNVDGYQVYTTNNVVGENMFARTILERIQLPTGVTSIGDNAFSSCLALTTITIPDAVTSIEYMAFYGCHALTNVTISSNVTSIAASAFTACTALTDLVIPDKVTSIGRGAFSECYSLTDIVIPISVTTLGDGAFHSCKALSSVTIGSGITLIDAYTFEYCYALTSVTLPDGLTSIGEEAFSGCRALSAITIPDSVTSIGYGAFSDCLSLASVTIPSGVTSIEGMVFYDCPALTNITIPDGVTSIGTGAFWGCPALTNITIPDGVTSIGSDAFRDCPALTNIIIPSGVTMIESDTFSGCAALAKITIPNGVTSIGSHAFWHCTSLAEVTSNAITPPTLGAYAFDYIASTAKLIVPTGTTTAYSESDWAQYFITIDDGESHGNNEDVVVTLGTAGTLSTLIPEDEKYTITKLKIVGPLNGDDIRFIREMAGMDIENQITEGKLVDLDLSDATIIRGGDYYYYETSSGGGTYYYYIQHDNVIGQWMFAKIGLKNLVLPTQTTEIIRDAFDHSSLEYLTIPDAVTTIGDFSFYSSRSLTNVTIGTGVTTIGRSAFYYCTSLSEVTCNPTTPPTLDETGVFSNIAGSATLFVPIGCASAYRSSDWANWFTTIEEVTR